jgi:hypothetical protein
MAASIDKSTMSVDDVAVRNVRKTNFLRDKCFYNLSIAEIMPCLQEHEQLNLVNAYPLVGMKHLESFFSKKAKLATSLLIVNIDPILIEKNENKEDIFHS